MARSIPYLAAMFLMAACSDDSVEGGANGDGGATPDMGDPACSTLCERVVFCTAKAHADDVYLDEYDPQPVVVTCEWNEPEEATSECLSGCDAVRTTQVARDCIACLSDRLVCDGTAAMRPCDIDCEVTEFVTGEDGEGAAVYDYTVWFFDNVDDPALWTCEAEPE